MTLAQLATLPLPSAVADRADLTRAIDFAVSVVERRNTYPILANVHLKGDGSTLFVTGTDMDIEVVVAVPAAADSRFDVTLPAHLLRDLLKGAPKADFVAFTATTPDKIHVDFETAQSVVAGLPTDSFPKPEHGKFSHRFSMSGAALVAMLHPVAFCISNEETRYYLNGIYLHAPERTGRLRAVATDGHRMARQDCELPTGAADMPPIIIPKKTVGLILKHMKGRKCPASVDIEISDTQVRLYFDGVTITSKVVDGTFPDYERVTPKNNDKALRVNVAAVTQAIASVSAIASERGGKAVKLVAAEGKLTLSVTNPDSGTAEVSVAAEFDFPTFEIGFNARYLTDILAFVGETAEFMFNDAGSSTLIREPGASALYVLMPMRV